MGASSSSSSISAFSTLTTEISAPNVLENSIVIEAFNPPTESYRKEAVPLEKVG